MSWLVASQVASEVTRRLKSQLIVLTPPHSAVGIVESPVLIGLKHLRISQKPTRTSHNGLNCPKMTCNTLELSENISECLRTYQTISEHFRFSQTYEKVLICLRTSHNGQEQHRNAWNGQEPSKNISECNTTSQNISLHFKTLSEYHKAYQNILKYLINF